ncbi:MAG: hypothetical protein LCH63_15425 [Candidatus Melainabacteria bacterium]|nr:hypothetical protein [Candidatus Melainabacteria bacterium]OPZ89320.1 MAG: putative CtpA-like serine protease [bacterium ADurb.Bin425]
MTDKSFFSRALSLVVAGSLLCLSAAPGLAQSAPAQKAPAKGEEFIIIIDGKEPNKLQIFGPSVKPKTAPQQTVPNPAVDPKAPTPTVDPNAAPAQPSDSTKVDGGSDQPSIEGIPLDDPQKLKEFLEKHGIAMPGAAAPQAPSPQDLEDFYHEVWRLVAMKYYNESKLVGWETWYDKYKGKLLTVKDLESALSEMLGGVGDRWTQYTTSDTIERSRARAKNDIVDLGISVAPQKDGTYKIDFLSYGTPGWKSNAFRTGDTLKSVHVNPQDPATQPVNVKGLSAKDVDELLQQKVGTKVSVVIAHDGIEEKVDLSFEKPDRAPIMLKPLPNNIGYIRLPTFGSDQGSVEALGNAFVEGLAKLDGHFKGNMQGIVLDLRGNSGGAVELAKMIASIFIRDGSFIKEQEREGRLNKVTENTFKAPMPYQFVGVPPEVLSLMSRLYTMPMVVLVNGSSASSSEILTGTLMDNNRAVVVGTQTFGKAVAFIVMPTPAGGFLQVTTMHYLTPNGNDIAGKGIAPNVAIDNKRGSQATDDQLSTAVKIVSDAITKMNGAGQTQVPAQQGGQSFGGDSVLWIGIGLGLIALIVVLGGFWHHTRKQRDEAERRNK